MNLRNVKLTVEYDGTDYSGWQIQNKTQKKTVQGKVEKALGKVLSREIKIVGAARTDCGVHARGQVANFLTDSGIPLNNLVRAINGFLPRDIAVLSAQEVSADFNARYSAKSKTYLYTISNAEIIHPLDRRFSWCLPIPLDIKLVKKTAKFFLGEHNFSAFSCRGSERKREICRIVKFRVSQKNEMIYCEIEGTNFLYKMIRRMIGGLIEVGRKKLNKELLHKAIQTGCRDFYLPTAPPRGLCLLKVNY